MANLRRKHVRHACALPFSRVSSAPVPLPSLCQACNQVSVSFAFLEYQVVCRPVLSGKRSLNVLKSVLAFAYGYMLASVLVIRLATTSRLSRQLSRLSPLLVCQPACRLVPQSTHRPVCCQVIGLTLLKACQPMCRAVPRPSHLRM